MVHGSSLQCAVICTAVQMYLIFIIFLVDPIFIFEYYLVNFTVHLSGKNRQNRKNRQGKCNKRARPEKGGIREGEFLYVTV